MKITPYLIAACLLATGLSSACSSAPAEPAESTTRKEKTAVPEQSAQELFLQVNQKLDLKDYKGAISLYDRALTVDPARWDIYMNKGIAHSSLQQFSQAVDAMDAALNNGGDAHAEVYFNLGNIYQNRGLYVQSIKAYRSSLALRERPHVDTILNIAAGLMFMRELDQAEKTYAYLQTLAPDDARLYVGLELLEQAREHYDKAAAHYDHALLVDPGYAHAYFMKGSLEKLTEKYADSIQSFERYIELAPDGPYARPARIRIEAMKSRQ